MFEKKIKSVFMGTPQFAATILEKISKCSAIEIVGVYTQPDRPSGRGQKYKQSPVKEFALSNGLTVFQPLNFNSDLDYKNLVDLKPDVLLVAAYGLILPQKILDIAMYGAINVHASLLPKYRGAAPIQRCIFNGDSVTGISIMQMEKGLDSGPIILQRGLAIGYQDTSSILHDELSELGGELLIETLEALNTTGITFIAQDSSKSTYAPKLRKDEGLIIWNRSAREIHNQIRAFTPWPGAYFDWVNSNGKTITLNILSGREGNSVEKDSIPGTFLGLRDGALVFACFDKEYLVTSLKPTGGKILSAEQFYCGYLNK